MLTGSEPSGPAELAPQMEHPRLAEVVAGILRTRIVEGELADGARLPKQDDLLRELRVSRPTLREAMRILEAEGLLTVRRGNVGGAIVRVPRAQSSAYMFGLVLQSMHVELRDLAEALRSVEPVAAALCALREDRHETVIPKVRACLRQAEAAIDDGVRFTALSRRFHEELVRGCGNETLIVMLGTLELMWSQQERRWAQHAQDKGSYPRPEARKDVVTAHQAILHAIERGDGDLAAKVARVHLSASQRYTLSSDGTMIVQAVPPRGTPPSF
jgi:DNA-binding FadR family transcriptional regulator